MVKNHSAALKNFGLSEGDFLQMLRELQEGRKDLFEKIFLAHFDDCMAYLKRRYQASSEDAYDATMDAMLMFCKRLQAGQIAYGNLRFLFTQMAGQIYLKWIKKQLPKESIDNIQIAEAPPQLEAEDLHILNQAWSKMCDNCRGLLIAFYYQNISLKDIAERSNKTAAAIRKQKQRCMEKLQTLFAQHS